VAAQAGGRRRTTTRQRRQGAVASAPDGCARRSLAAALKGAGSAAREAPEL